MPYLFAGRWNKNQKYSFRLRSFCVRFWLSSLSPLHQANDLRVCPLWFRVTPARHCCCYTENKAL